MKRSLTRGETDVYADIPAGSNRGFARQRDVARVPSRQRPTARQPARRNRWPTSGPRRSSRVTR